MLDVLRPSRTVVTRCVAICVLVSVATLFLRDQLAFYIARSSYDDYYFVRQAAFLARGQWLGPYDKLTLAKGPAYPAFVALTHWLGVDLKVGEQLTLLAAAAMVALSIWMVTQRLWLTTAVFLVMALNPISFTLGSAGVLRDGWYASLCILFPAAVFVAVFGALSRVKWGCWLASSVVAGLSGAAMLLCREEGVASLPPAFIIAALLPLTVLLRRMRRAPGRNRRFRLGLLSGWRSVAAVAAINVSLVGPVVGVVALNNTHYGVGLINDSASGTFVDAYAAWSRVQAGRRQPQIPINKAQRLAVYAISPAATELEPVLENPKNAWLLCRASGCDFSGAFTIWAIRDAAEAAGHFKNARGTQTFFGELASQIQAGCDAKVLTCKTKLPGPLQPLTQASFGRLWSTGVNQFGATLWSRYFITPAQQRTVPAAVFEDYSNVADDVPANAAQNAARNLNAEKWHWVFEVFFWIYRILIPLLVALGLIGLVRGFSRRNRVDSALTILTSAMLVGLLARLGTLALVQVTQFTTAQARYQATTQMFMITMAVVGSAGLADQIARRRSWLRPAGIGLPIGPADPGSTLIDP